MMTNELGVGYSLRLNQEKMQKPAFQRQLFDSAKVEEKTTDAKQHDLDDKAVEVPNAAE